MTMDEPRSERVLVVDDEAAIRDIVRRYLTAQG
jgi:CheY-like chemotaxis protein